MLDQRLRRTKEKVLGPLGAAVAPHAPPLALTLGGLLLTLAAAGLAAVEQWSGALVLWLLGRLLDGLDGVVARRRGAAGDLGGMLDLVADTVGYAAVPLGVAAGLDERGGWVAVAVLLATFYVNAVTWTYLAALLEKRAAGAGATGELTSTTMPAGLVEGTETIVLFALLLAVPGWAVATMVVMAVAVLATAAQRVVWAARGGLRETGVRGGDG